MIKFNSILLLLILVSAPLNFIFADSVEAKTKRFEKSFDKDSNGVVTKDEFVQTRTKWGRPEAESHKFFNYHDKDKNGEITLEEFTASK